MSVSEGTRQQTGQQKLPSNPVSNSLVPASDWLPKSTQYVKDIRKEQWDITTNKLKVIVPDLTDHCQIQCINRRDEVVLTRLRIGHNRRIYSHLLKDEPAPVCVGCDAPFTVRHILLDCVDFNRHTQTVLRK